MSIPAGSHRLGPGDGTLTVRTGRTGAAAAAGHDLLIEVAAWEATIGNEGPAAISLELHADAGSLRVVEGRGGVQPLDDDGRARILATIDERVLGRRDIAFHSTAVRPDGDGGHMAVQGELTLAGQTHPIAFDLAIGDDGRLTGSAVVKQTTWGIRPHSALLGTLKVADDVEVAIDAGLER